MTNSLSPKIVVLNSTNQVIHSDLFAPQTVVALTNPTLDGPMGLLVHRSGDYELLMWNATTKRFE
jgi:hypothetical protein